LSVELGVGAAERVEEVLGTTLADGGILWRRDARYGRWRRALDCRRRGVVYRRRVLDLGRGVLHLDSPGRGMLHLL